MIEEELSRFVTALISRLRRQLPPEGEAFKGDKREIKGGRIK